MNSVALPYPVLGRSDDYIGVDFQVAIRPNLKEHDNKRTIEIDYIFDLSDEAILTHIKTGKASYGLEIVCPGTALRYVELLEQEGVITLDPTQVYGKVEISPKVFVIDRIEDFSSPNFNSEFGVTRFILQPGDYLASDTEQVIYVDFGRLNFTALIKVQKMDTKHPFTYDFGLDGNTIVIGMGTKIHTLWHALRHNHDIQPFLIMSIYKDCIVAALDYLKGHDDLPEQTWAQALGEMLQKKDLTIPKDATFGRLNETAQILLEDLGVKKVKYL